MKRLIGLALAVAALSSPVAALAQTSAYWRHEEGTNGALIPAGPDTVLDASGSGNHMQTFDPTFTSATYTSSVSPVPLRSGLSNTRALDFGPGGDEDRFRGGLDDDNFTDGKPIQTQVFTAMTVEVAFSMGSVGPGQYQAVFGKDGKPTDGPAPPFKVLIRGDDFPDAVPHQIFVEWFDGDGDIHFLASGQSVTPGNWNHLAFTLSPTTAALWLAGETGSYSMLDSKTDDFAGLAGEVMINTAGTYTMGRGMFGGGITDWSDAFIDEVRVSSSVLASDQFLFNAVPEPASLTLLAAAAVCCAAKRRRAPR